MTRDKTAEPGTLRAPRLQADLALLSVSVIWGTAFVAQRVVAPTSSVFLFNGLRFALAAAALAPVAWWAAHKTPGSGQPAGGFPAAFPARQIDRNLVIGAGVAGLLLTAGAALQQAGLRYTTAGNAGFITGLYVVFIPIIQTVFQRQPPRPVIWGAAALAAAGLFLLSTGGSLVLKLGDLLELIGALFWALHVIWIGRQVQRSSVLNLAVGQYLVCGLLSLSLGLLFEPSNLRGVSGAGWAILYTGLVSVGLGYTLQIWGQRQAPPADAAILLSMEAVFAALAGWLFLNETLNAAQLLGCGIMLAGMLLAQLNSFQNRSESQ